MLLRRSMRAAMANRSAVSRMGRGQSVHTHASAVSPHSHTWTTRSSVVGRAGGASGNASTLRAAFASLALSNILSP
jgi:hypothetical protein